MNRVLLQQIWRFATLRIAIVAVITALWGWLILLFYSQFSEMLRQLVRQNTTFQQFANFGSGNLFTIPGAITLGTQHPFLLALIGIFAVGSGSVAIAGERQAGTLEVVLARPLPRRAYLLTWVVAILGVVALLVAMLLLGMLIGVLMYGYADELQLGALPLVWINGVLLWAAFTTFSLAASASFDRPGPAIGLAIAYLLANYFVVILASLWDAAAWTESFSLFDHFQPSEILSGKVDPFDFVLLFVVAAVPLAYALWRFPRRDLAAPA
jgi:ABC-2 type transport system permease protein